jgi:hypothetical protein
MSTKLTTTVATLALVLPALALVLEKHRGVRRGHYSVRTRGGTRKGT